MRDKKGSVEDLPLPVFRTEQVGFRLTTEDAATLRDLARKAGVGHSTLARVIVEKYLADHRRKGRG